jgi:hypothetical protein
MKHILILALLVITTSIFAQKKTEKITEPESTIKTQTAAPKDTIFQAFEILNDTFVGVGQRVISFSPAATDLVELLLIKPTLYLVYKNPSGKILSKQQTQPLQDQKIPEPEVFRKIFIYVDNDKKRVDFGWVSEKLDLYLNVVWASKQ